MFARYALEKNGEAQRTESEGLAATPLSDYECVAKRMLPITLSTASSQATDWALEKILERVGLAGVKDAGPIAITGTAVGAVIGCAKSIASGGGH
jgi:hypothetical protein